MAISRSVVEP